MRGNENMKKDSFAVNPPMGWNSYDYYNTAVTEDEIRANAKYMAENLKQYGWEYVVVDIEWFSPDVGVLGYVPFAKLYMDEYSRLIPDPVRFPSSADGNGFTALADYVHSLGLKFGIHIMRGIPRIAAHNHTKLMGTDRDASYIAEASSICPWNPDMYGVNPYLPESQIYYDSIMQLYSEWGVDFIKCDDICRMDAREAEMEIEMLHKAIMKTGRPIVFSLSPGPALPEKNSLYSKCANMWRITDDMWDRWSDILNMFERCEIWQGRTSKGCFPDCDMLPIGRLQGRYSPMKEHYSNFTWNEKIVMMTLWCIFRSPLMIGSDLPQLGEDIKLLTNSSVLKLLTDSYDARQIYREKDVRAMMGSEVPPEVLDVQHLPFIKSKAVWMAKDKRDGVCYAAFFNLSEDKQEVSLSREAAADYLDCEEFSFENKSIAELWTGNRFTAISDLTVELDAHSANLFRIEKI